MTRDKIKEFLALCKIFRKNFADGVNQVEELKLADKCLKTAEDLATLVLNAEMPKEKEPRVMSTERSDGSGIVSPGTVFSLVNDFKKKELLNDIYKTEGYLREKKEV